MEKVVYANPNQKKVGVAIIMSDRVDLRAWKVLGDKEGHYIVIKGSIFQEDITILNIYAPNNRILKHMGGKLMELQVEIGESTVRVGDFNILLLEIDRNTRQ